MLLRIVPGKWPKTVVFLQVDCSDDFAVLYADVHSLRKSSLFCVTYDPGFQQLPVHREDAVTILILFVLFLPTQSYAAWYSYDPDGASWCAENWFSLLCTLSQTLDLEKFCYCTLTFTSVVSLVQLRTITSFSLSCWASIFAYYQWAWCCVCLWQLTLLKWAVEIMSWVVIKLRFAVFRISFSDCSE